MSTPPLPTGYALDSKPQSAPPLPPGYALDSSAQIPDAMAQSAAQTKGVVRDVTQGMSPSFFGGAHPSSEAEATINTARPQIPGMVSSIRQNALSAGGGAIGGEIGAGLGRGLPWLTRALAGASGSALGSGAGTLAAGGSPKAALATGAGYAATSAPLEMAATGLKAAQPVLQQIARDPITGKIRTPWELAVDKLLPDPYAPQTIPAKPIPRGTNYGQFLENQKVAAKQAAATAKQQAKLLPWETPVEKNPGAPLPAAGEFYENKGTELLNRQKAQDLMDREAARTAKANAPAPQKPDPFYGMTSSDKPIGNAKVPQPGTYPLPQIAPPPPEPAGVASAEGVSGSLPKPSGRLVVLPEEARSLDQMQKIAKTRASEHGMLYAAGMRPAGGGRVPRSPTATNTTEFSGIRPEVPQGNPTPFSSPTQFKGGINQKGVEASNVQMSPEDTMTGLSTEIGRMKTALRNSTGRPTSEQADLQNQINEYQQRLDELRGPAKRLPWMKQ